MRKILMLSDYDPPPSDGPAEDAPQYGREIDAVAAEGFAFELVRMRRTPWNPLAGRHAVYRALDPARALWAMTRRRDAAAAISFAESGMAVPLLLRPLAPWPMMVMHDSDHQNWRPRRAVQSYVLPRADLVLVQTHAQGRYLSEQYRLRRPPFFVGPRIDEVFYTPPSAPDAGYILAVGNDAARDFAGLIAAAAPLDLTLRLLTRLKLDIPSGTTCRIEVIDRRVSFAEMRALYAGARAVALPLRERISPGGMTSLLEAMAMGKPLVMTASSGVIELVEDGVSALVTPVGDVAAMRAALQQLMDDPARAAAMGMAARARLDANYTTRHRAQRLVAAVRMMESGAPARLASAAARD